jgi:hypothetical protein
MRKEGIMLRTRILATLTAAIGASLFAAGALAHETDMHHWFEHQRALVEGGTVGIIETQSLAPGNGNGGRGFAAARVAQRRVIAEAPDCFIEQLQMSEGFVPSGACPREYADERWIVDEDKDRGRRAQGGAAR